MTPPQFDIDDDLSFADNIKAFTDLLGHAASELASALEKELSYIPEESTEGRDAALDRLFSAMPESESESES